MFNKRKDNQNKRNSIPRKPKVVNQERRDKVKGIFKNIGTSLLDVVSGGYGGGNAERDALPIAERIQGFKSRAVGFVDNIYATAEDARGTTAKTNKIGSIVLISGFCIIVFGAIYALVKAVKK